MPSSVSTLAYSPRASPLGSPTTGSPSRRVQTRKGSMCAGDPWGTHSQLNLNPSRSTSCKLTIVRVNEPPVHLDETPPSPQQRRHHGFGGHRRQGSGGSIHSNSSIGGGNKSDGPSRISFAGNSFVPPGSSRDGNGSRPTSPVMNRPRSPGAGHHHRSSTASNKPRLSPDELVTLARQTCTPSAPIHVAPSPGATKQPGTSPASFTALPDEFFLPFIDRAAEVSSLFSGPPSAKLLTLLEQTFATSPVSSPMSQSESTSPSLDVFAVDPKRWTFSQLEHWLKNIDRDQAPDPYWVASARRCVLAHSELIWERLKGALGVPPELDESDFEELGDVINVIPDMEFVAPEKGDNADQATGLVDEVLAGSMSPEFSHIAEHRAATEDIPEADLAPSLSIEPVLTPTSPQPPSADHPPTRIGAHRMTDISEDIREENEEEGEGGSGSGPATAAAQSPPSEVIQGLRISTVPASPSILASSSPSARRLSLSASPLPPMAALPTDRISPLVIDEQRRDGSHSPEKDAQHSRDSSPVVGMGGRIGTGWNYAASTGSAGSDSVYDAVAERGPGNPLFPTSFARLALGPTLQANNPSMRSPTAPPPPVFGNNPHAIRMAMRGRRALPSWAEGWDPLKHEYALTLASGSSVGGY